MYYFYVLKARYTCLLIHKNSTYDNTDSVEVRALMPYDDIELGHKNGGAIFEVDRLRADDLISKGKVEEI